MSCKYACTSSSVRVIKLGLEVGMGTFQPQRFHDPVKQGLSRTFKQNIPRAWAAVILFLWSLFKSLFTKSLASGDIDGQGESSKLGFALSTDRNIPDSVRAQNGLLPHNNMYVITPMLHKSASTL